MALEFVSKVHNVGHHCWERHHLLPAVRGGPSANQQHGEARQWGTHLPQQPLQTPLSHLSTSLRGTVFFSSRAIRICSGVMVFMPDRLDSCRQATALKKPGKPGTHDGTRRGRPVSTEARLSGHYMTHPASLPGSPPSACPCRPGQLLPRADSSPTICACSSIVLVSLLKARSVSGSDRLAGSRGWDRAGGASLRTACLMRSACRLPGRLPPLLSESNSSPSRMCSGPHCKAQVTMFVT